MILESPVIISPVTITVTIIVPVPVIPVVVISFKASETFHFPDADVAKTVDQDLYIVLAEAEGGGSDQPFSPFIVTPAHFKHLDEVLAPAQVVNADPVVIAEISPAIDNDLVILHAVNSHNRPVVGCHNCHGQEQAAKKCKHFFHGTLFFSFLYTTPGLVAVRIVVIARLLVIFQSRCQSAPKG